MVLAVLFIQLNLGNDHKSLLYTSLLLTEKFIIKIHLFRCVLFLQIIPLIIQPEETAAQEAK